MGITDFAKASLRSVVSGDALHLGGAVVAEEFADSYLKPRFVGSEL